MNFWNTNVVTVKKFFFFKKSYTNTLTNELALVNQWLPDNSLLIHEGKTECILFGTGARLASASNFSVSIDGQDLKQATKARSTHRYADGQQ